MRLRGKNLRLSTSLLERGASSLTTASSSMLFTDPQSFRQTVQNIADTHRPIHLEIGMGQGLFLSMMSRLYPHHVFIGIDRYDTLLVRAWQKLIAVHEGHPPKNVILFRHHLRDLSALLPPHALDTVYLQFSDPWPKKRHERRRLTYASYLWQYRDVLKKSGRIVFKTDHADFFAYSLASFESNQWSVIQHHRDLQQLRETRLPMFMETGAVETFYEKLQAVSTLKTPSAGRAFWQYVQTRLVQQSSSRINDAHDGLRSMGYLWEAIWKIHPSLFIPTEYEMKFIRAHRPIYYAEIIPKSLDL